MHAGQSPVSQHAAACMRVQQLEVLSNVGVKVPYTLTVASSDYLELDSSWNWDAALSGSTIDGIVSQARACTRPACEPRNAPQELISTCALMCPDSERAHQTRKG